MARPPGSAEPFAIPDLRRQAFSAFGRCERKTDLRRGRSATLQAADPGPPLVVPGLRLRDTVRFCVLVSLVRSETFLTLAMPHTDSACIVRHSAFVLRALIACAALSSGCIKTPQPPQTVCRLDSECATGRCLAGLCVSPAADAITGADSKDAAQDLQGQLDAATDAVDDMDDVGASAETSADGQADADGGLQTDADADAKVDSADAQVTCKVDQDCSAKLGALPACTFASCTDGLCLPAILPDETTCATDGLCPAPGDCESGVCVAGAAVCDDGEPCTADQCTTTGCNHLAFKNGTVCSVGILTCLAGSCGGGKCSGTLVAGQCLIDGACVTAGQARPDAPCLRCVPEISQTDWSMVTAVSCDDGDACTQGDACDLFGACTSTAVDCSDDNPCTDDTCKAETGCVALANEATCATADPCTTEGQCKSGTCVGGGAKDCNDVNPCTLDQCQAGLGCVHIPVTAPCSADTDPCTQDVCVGGTCVGVPLTSVCEIGGMCVPAGGKADGNDCLLCDPTKNPSNWTATPAAPCDDANACTFFDTCVADLCVGEIGSCDDKNACTQDSCEPETGCKFAPVTASCDDVNLCTVADACVAGKCVGKLLTAQDCADGNACTTDSCAAAVGCTHTPNGAPCDDGNACTAGDKCNAGICLSGGVKCACKLDADCNDGNTCTLDHCSAEGVCSNDILGPIVGCDDGNACTKLDTCATGYCQGLPVNCEDGNACTADGCVAETGCTSVAKPASACNDANACTSGDLCVNGVCSGTAKNCDDGNACTGDQCDPKTGACGHNALPDGAACPADTVACTADQCSAGSCTHDGIVAGSCLIAGACLPAGTVHPAQVCLGCLPLSNAHDWSPMTGLACSDGSACTQGDLCLAGNLCVGNTVVCDDNNPCTINGCNPLASESPCLYIAMGGSCSDGNACTANDTCQVGLCDGATVTCNDANPCTLDQCDASSGCVSTALPGSVACASDGLPCTADVCGEGSCGHVPVAGTCLIDGACHADGDATPLPICHACLAAVSQVSWSPVTGGACDDGNACTGQDVCLQGTCAGNPDAACDDKNPCTSDSCDPSGIVCAHAAQPGPCDDGDACTTSDFCSGGLCAGGAAVVCEAGALSNDCTQAVCDSTIGCTATSTCGPLHGCVTGLCVTLNPLGLPGPATLSLAPVAPSLPLLPTARWQEVHAGNRGQIPQLWLTAQSSVCDPALGTISRLTAAVLQPGDETVLAMDVPSAPGWCALHPVLLAHPATNTELVLAWLEGGDALSACPAAASGGRLRLGLVGQGADVVSAGPPASCPDSGDGTAPTQPALHLLALPGGNLDSVESLFGLVLRGALQGPNYWLGKYPDAWGGPGTPLPAGNVPGYLPMPAPSRPTHVVWPGGGAALSTAVYSKLGSPLVPVVDTVNMNADGQLAAEAVSHVGSIDLPGDPLVFHALSTAWDADAGRIGIVASGTLVSGGITKGFLAFHRISPEQSEAPAAHVIALFQAPADSGNSAAIQAVRITDLPGSADFLVAFAFPGSSNLQLVRVHPLDDLQTTLGPIATVATDFEGHWLGETVQAYGGLSELVIDPAGQRYTIVYESISGLSILTAPIPQ